MRCNPHKTDYIMFYFCFKPITIVRQQPFQLIFQMFNLNSTNWGYFRPLILFSKQEQTLNKTASTFIIILCGLINNCIKNAKQMYIVVLNIFC